MLNIWLLLIISCWIMLWAGDKAVFCLEILNLQTFTNVSHNNVIGRNEYLISTLSESSIP